MPRSSRHKSSKHSAREARDYSDSEKESSSRHLKESASSEKRKLDSKSVNVSKESSTGLVNVNYVDDYGASSSSSKKRKEKVDDDRWAGGDNDELELSKSEMKELKVLGDSKRSSKVESKHQRYDRKEKSEKDERKGSKTERLIDGVLGTDNINNEGNRKQGSHGEKHVVGNTDSDMQDDIQQNPDTERELDRRVRRKRDGSVDGDKHQDGVRKLDDRRLSSRDDIARSGKYKDEGRKDERIRDRYQEDVDRDNWHQDGKHRDNRPTRDHTSGRSDDKHLRNEKKDSDVSQKKSKSHVSEHERDLDRERDRDRSRDRERNQEREHGHHDHKRDRDRGRDREHDDRDHHLDSDRDRELDLERGHDRDRDLERDREHGRDMHRRERDRDRIRDHDHNHDRGRRRDYDHDHDFGAHVDDKGSRYKEDRGRRRSPDGYDDFHGDKSRRVESETDRERSLSRKAHVDSVTSSSRRRTSPSTRAYIGTDKYRDGIQDEAKYVNSLRDGIMSETLDKVPKYRSGEKRTNFGENHIGELSERSPNSKASPAGLKERSPSISVDRRFQSRTSRRRSLDVDEAERRSSGSNEIRDISVNEDRQGRDFSGKKATGEEYPPAESLFYHKSSQDNVSSHGPGPSGFRARAESPSFIGSIGEDSRGHSGRRYRRSMDPNAGRGPGNAWKGVPNWPSPSPNSFMPFPPGPPGPHHGGYPPMLSQFPPLFGVRPALDMNHPGIPYHMADGDRFSGHVRPMGWQNMVDGSLPPHFHGWDANNGVLRDEPSTFGPGNLANAQRRDMNADMSKPNGDANMDVSSESQKDGHMVKASVGKTSSAQGASRSHLESSCDDDQGTVHKVNTSSHPSATKDTPMTPAKVNTEKTPESSSFDDTAHSVHVYLAELDISMDLADPELYNQCINLAVKGQSEYIEEVELKYKEEKAVAESDIANLTMGGTFFPVAKDSMCQRAMDLYQTHSTKRKTSVTPNKENLPTSPASQPELEQISVRNKEVDIPVDYSVIKEEQNPVVPEEVGPTIGEGEEKGPVPITSHKPLNGGPPLQCAEPILHIGDESRTPVEKMEEETRAEFVTEEDDVDKGQLSVESTWSDAVDSSAKRESASDEQPLDVAVSGPLVLSHDSVKVCEALISVSNESESVLLSRIHHHHHHAPESTH